MTMLRRSVFELVIYVNMLTICCAIQIARVSEEAFQASGALSDEGADETRFHALVRIFRGKSSYEDANCHRTGEGRHYRLYSPIPSCTENFQYPGEIILLLAYILKIGTSGRPEYLADRLSNNSSASARVLTMSTRSPSADACNIPHGEGRMMIKTDLDGRKKKQNVLLNLRPHLAYL